MTAEEFAKENIPEFERMYSGDKEHIIKALNDFYNQALEDYQKELIVNDNSVIGAFNKLKK